VAGAVEIRDAGGHFSGRGLSLDEGRVEKDLEAGVTAADNVEEIADDGAGGRGDDADAMRKGGERLFTGGIEEAACFQALLELFKGDLQRAGADGFEEFGDQLHLAALLINGDFSAQENMEAVGGAEAKERGLFAEEDRGKLRVAILKSEVDVAGGGGSEVRDLAFDPEVAVLALDVEADFADEVADLPDAAREGGSGGLEGEAELAAGPGLRAGRGVHVLSIRLGELGAWSLELGAGSLELGAWSWEPGAWSWEPGAGSGETEAGRRKRKRPSPNCGFLLKSTASEAAI